MSDLDTATRAQLARMVDETMERRNGLTSILPGTGMSRVISAVQKLIDDHKPIGIYEECGHFHRGDEPGVREFDDVGLVCADGLMYEVCASCCDWNPLSGQTEHCVTEHDHHHGGVHCMVVYSISESLGVSGEDRSEPTPEPREPRVWRHGVHTGIDVDVNDVAGTTTGRRWQRMPGKQFVWTSSGCAYSTGTVLYVENEVSEVVTPEGTS